jgi:hypothetical protein
LRPKATISARPSSRIPDATGDAIGHYDGDGPSWQVCGPA